MLALGCHPAPRKKGLLPSLPLAMQLSTLFSANAQQTPHLWHRRYEQDVAGTAHHPDGAACALRKRQRFSGCRRNGAWISARDAAPAAGDN